jgi:hypothetical protein
MTPHRQIYLPGNGTVTRAMLIPAIRPPTNIVYSQAPATGANVRSQLQDELDALQAAGGGELVLGSAGTYGLASSLNITSKAVRLVGLGREVTRLMLLGTPANFTDGWGVRFVAPGSTGPGLEGCGLENLTVDADTPESSLVYMSGVTAPVVRHARLGTPQIQTNVSQVVQNCLRLAGADQACIEASLFAFGENGRGIYLTAGSRPSGILQYANFDNHFTRCQFWANHESGSVGLQIDGTWSFGGHQIQGGNVWGAEKGVVFNGLYVASVDGMWLDTCGTGLEAEGCDVVLVNGGWAAGCNVGLKFINNAGVSVRTHAFANSIDLQKIGTGELTYELHGSTNVVLPEDDTGTTVIGGSSSGGSTPTPLVFAKYQSNFTAESGAANAVNTSNAISDVGGLWANGEAAVVITVETSSSDANPAGLASAAWYDRGFVVNGHSTFALQVNGTEYDLWYQAGGTWAVDISGGTSDPFVSSVSADDPSGEFVSQTHGTLHLAATISAGFAGHVLIPREAIYTLRLSAALHAMASGDAYEVTVVVNEGTPQVLLAGEVDPVVSARDFTLSASEALTLSENDQVRLVLTVTTGDTSSRNVDVTWSLVEER